MWLSISIWMLWATIDAASLPHAVAGSPVHLPLSPTRSSTSSSTVSQRHTSSRTCARLCFDLQFTSNRKCLPLSLRVTEDHQIASKLVYCENGITFIAVWRDFKELPLRGSIIDWISSAALLWGVRTVPSILNKCYASQPVFYPDLDSFLRFFSLHFLILCRPFAR